MKKDSKIYRGKKERVKSIALKAKKESSGDETSTSESDDEEYAIAVRNFKKFFRRKGKFVRQPREEKKSFQHSDEKKGKKYNNSPSWNCHAFYDDDDEDSIQYEEYLKNSSNAITPVLPTEEPDNSLSMEDEHLSTIQETKSDEEMKSSVEDLVPIPKCTSSDDVSFEDIDYVEASPRDSKLVSLEEMKNDILYEKLLNINLLIACDLPSSDDFSPVNKSLSDEDILKDNVKIYSNPLFEFDDEYISSDVNHLFDEDSKGDIHFLEELLSNDTPPLPKNESSNFDHHDDPSFSRPPPELPDVEVFFDFEPDTGVLAAKVVEDISEHHVLMPKVLPTQPALCLNIDTLLPFSSENEDKVFKLDLEASRARGFVHGLLELKSLAYGNLIS
nr:transposase, Ptta/En/Spm, transposase, Tnp1/En/Spm-like protein [Tanacetum cinerariifolium]